MANALSPGSRLDRYEILGLLAEGGMASVRLARMTGTRGFEKLVAIKTIKVEFGRDKEFEHMFLDEARIASRVEHPNVAQIIDLGEVNGVLYLVMELVDGDALSRLRMAVTKAQGQFPVGVALRIMADTCAGLHAAHELRDDHGQPLEVVHRDVSPQNILVSTRGAIKLIDFGIVKAKNRMLAETEAGTFKGKIHYMPPEQALTGKIDRRVDVWAVGACLQYLLTGRKPYEPLGEADVIQQLMHGQPPNPLGPEYPEIVRAILQACLAPDPRYRFESASALQRALEGALSELRMPTTSDDVAAFTRQYLHESHDKRRAFIQQALERAAQRAAGTGNAYADAPPPSFARPSMPTASSPIHHREGTRSGYDPLEPTPPPISPTLKATQLATGLPVAPVSIRQPFAATAVAVRESELPVEVGPTFPAALAIGRPVGGPYPAPPPAFDAPPSQPIPMAEPIPTYESVRTDGAPTSNPHQTSAPPTTVTPKSNRGRAILIVLAVLIVVQAAVIGVLYWKDLFGK